MSVADSYFEKMFRESQDPWHFRERWYEQRKRALTLAMLPKARYQRVFEPGCANGELSALLAQRCDQLLCCDTSPAAVELARQRLDGLENTEVSLRRLPAQWPPGTFDLIVLSELCYYLDADDLDHLITLARNSLTDSGALLACHWRMPIDGCPLNADQVHQRLHEGLGLSRLCQHHDADFLLDLWTRDGVSVATAEGLR